MAEEQELGERVINTGKVLIGARYQPPPPTRTPSRDELNLQEALLGIRKSWWHQMVRWLTKDPRDG